MSPLDMMFQRYGPNYKWLVTVTMLLGLVALGMSITIVNVATPHIKGSLGISDAEVQWISTGFLAATTVALLVAPWLSQAFGQRATYLGLLTVFIAASLLGGFATSLGAIVTARVVQGAMTGLLRPLAMEALYSVFPIQQRGMATAIYGMSLGLPLTLATVVGGWLVETLSWHYVFFVALPMCVAAMVMGFFFLPGRMTDGPRPPFDWLGAVTLFAAIFSLLAAISNAPRWGWESEGVQGLLLLTLVLTIVFICWEQRIEKPLLDLSIFRHKGFMAGCSSIFLFGGAFYAIMYLLPLFVQTILNYDPITAGMMFLPSTIVLAVLVPIVGKLSDRWPPHYLTIPGLGFAIYAVYRFAQIDDGTSFASLAWSLTLLCAGMATFPPPTFARSIGSLPVALIGYGSGVINFVLQLGGALGTAALVLLMERRTAFHSDHLSEGLMPGNSVAMSAFSQLQGVAGRVGTSESQQAYAAAELIGRMETFWASIYAYQDGFWVVVAALTIILIPSWLLTRWSMNEQQKQ